MQLGRYSCALVLFFGLVLRLSAADPVAKTDVIANSIGLKLALIPAGEFLMGSHESLDDIEASFPGNEYKSKLQRKILDEDEWPQHKVRITKPFRLGVYEVTVGQFRQYLKDTGAKSEAETEGGGVTSGTQGVGGWGINKDGKFVGRKADYSWQNTGYELTDEHPVVNVTWNDATRFCEWLSKKEGKKYRLPTEAEWEYACRAGTKTRYASGNDPASLAKVANLADASSISAGQKEFPDYGQFAIKANDGHFTPAKVGSFAANSFGLHDMHGNVWEWCSDFYDENYYSKSPVDDPKGPETGRVYVRRGGAFHTFPIFVRSSFRNWNGPKTRYLNLGFRVACDQ